MAALQQGCGRAGGRREGLPGARTPLLLQAGWLLSGKGPGPGDTAAGQDRFFYASEWQGSWATWSTEAQKGEGLTGPPRGQVQGLPGGRYSPGRSRPDSAARALSLPTHRPEGWAGEPVPCHPQVMSHLRDMGRMHRVCATRGFDGERTEQDRTLLGKGPEMGRRVLKVPCFFLEKRTCVPSSRTVSAQGPGCPSQLAGTEERAPGPRDA